MFYLSLASASKVFIGWIQKSVNKFIGLNGHITFRTTFNGCYQLKYAKREALLLVKALYYDDKVTHLSRKYLKIKRSLAIVHEQKKGLLTK